MSLRRIACIDVPDLPLQMLVRENPSYRNAPVALVEEERPEAQLLLLNPQARALRLMAGMRLGAAKSLVPELRAGAVSALALEQMVAELVRALQTFSPHVERDPVSAGVFYVDPCGLSHLYGGELPWARAVQRALHARRLQASVVVAYGRALSYALVRGMRGVRVVDELETALTLAHEVALERLSMQPRLRASLERLGLSTLGDLSRFGQDQLGLRFGAEAARWCAVAQGHEVLPLCPEPHLDTPCVALEIEPPDSDVARLCFALKRGLELLLEEVRRRGQSVRALWMRLVLERAGKDAQVEVQRLEPSSSTRSAQLLLELLRLRLTTLVLPGPVERVVLEAEVTELAAGQLALFGPKRDVAAGDRALARLKASYGPHVVCRAVIRDAHLPEARYRWVELARIALPARTEQELAREPLPLIRRVLQRPEPLAGRLEIDPDTGARWLVQGSERLALRGPYRISGGWWVREVTRDYYYARSERGELSWIFFDRPRARWFLHAWVD